MSDYKLKTNCRIQYAKDIKEDGKTFDIITIDTFVDNNWKEKNFIFTAEERDNYKDLIEVAELAKILTNKLYAIK